MKKILLTLFLANILYADLYSLPRNMSKITGNLENRKQENLYNTIDYNWLFDIKQYVIYPMVFIEDGKLWLAEFKSSNTDKFDMLKRTNSCDFQHKHQSLIYLYTSASKFNLLI